MDIALVGWGIVPEVDEDTRYADACRAAATGFGKACYTCVWCNVPLSRVKDYRVSVCSIGVKYRECYSQNGLFYWRPFFIQSSEPPVVSS